MLKWPVVPEQVLALAQALSPESKDLLFHHNIVLVAESEPFLQQIRAKRFAVLQRLAAPPATKSLAPEQARGIELALEHLAIDRALAELEQLERYLRRLVVRRDRDLRALIGWQGERQPASAADE